MRSVVLPVCFLLLFVSISAAQPAMENAPPADSAHEHHGMQMDADGMVMNENYDQLPRDCDKIAGEQTVTIHAGRKYAEKFNGTIFAYDQHEWDVAPCTKVTVTLVNEDSVRHQWMLHGLPRYLHPEGMFHLEVNGRGSKTGVFITPGASKTYLVHCDVAQHMEKGMKAQLKVGGGSGDLPSIPGITAARYPEANVGATVGWRASLIFLLCMLGAALAMRGLK